MAAISHHRHPLLTPRSSLAPLPLRVRLDPLPALAAVGFALLEVEQDALVGVYVASAGDALTFEFCGDPIHTVPQCQRILVLPLGTLS